VPKVHQLAFLPTDSTWGINYLCDMGCALTFAKENRKRMMNVVEETMLDFGFSPLGERIDVHHNYAAMENHFGKNVMVHRKGAVRARDGELVLIPGSMGSPSYIAKGLGNRDSFTSCSHGAGRRMSRTAAKNDELVRASRDLMDTPVYSGNDNYDEAPGAYKDIEDVMNQQKDLVSPVFKLTPLATIKA
jgi:tRNA-splicing ligase RtcB